MTLRMEELQSPVTENIISLTLEVITLLTGEDYDVVRRCSAPYPGTPTLRAVSRGHSPVLQLRHCLPTRDLESDKKILEATNKIIHLLTGEVWKFLATVNDVTLQEHQRHSHQESPECSQMEAASDDINEESIACPEGDQQHGDPSMANNENYGVHKRGERGTATKHEGDCKSFQRVIKGLAPNINGEQNNIPGGDQSPKSPESYHTKTEPLEEDINPAFADLSRYNVRVKKELCEEILPGGSQGNDPELSERTESVRYEDKESTRLDIRGHYIVPGTEEDGAPDNALPWMFDERSYNQPKMTPKTDKIHKCQICHKSFSTFYHLVNHQKVHEPSKSIVCLECGKCFTRKATYMVHLKIHTGEKPFHCSVCNKSFRIRRSLILHQMTHTGEKPYVCLECNKGFITKNKLTQHQRLHTGEKPYCCSLCGTTYRVRQSLILHLRTHTGEKPYSCDVCDKRFNTSSSLGHHRWIHAGDRRFSCEECGKTFRQSGQLSRHRLTHSKD